MQLDIEMILKRLLLILIIFRFAESKIYLYQTKDGYSVESYDCIYMKTLLFCRRPTELIDLHRQNRTEQCHHNGEIHWFDQLQLNNTNIKTILHQWKSSIEKVEEYSRYLKYPTESNDYLCECIHPQSFGKNCEYMLPMGTSLEETFDWTIEMQLKHPWDVQRYSDIVCYRTLECNSGLLCLDWRDICNGVQECMSGLDEENCEELEFNECEKTEYRCMNGMCIPDEYFLDGQFDCMDWSDEIQYYDDEKCALNGVDPQCEDRTCPPNQWSCGDGQCIRDRLAFQQATKVKSECIHRRDQYFLCEIHYGQPMWTMPNGKCHLKVYEDIDVRNRTIEEECYYLLRCDLSAQAEKNCPCGRTVSCEQPILDICPTEVISYPKGAIEAPYIFYFYNRTRPRAKFAPDYVQYNGTLKCGTSIIDFHSIEPFSYNMTLKTVVNNQCQKQTTMNYSSDFIYICNRSRESISVYRIRDGIRNCLDGMDEREDRLLSTTIDFHKQHHRFRCSNNELTYLSITVLGDSENNCANKFDELWFGAHKRLLNMNCNNQYNDECHLLRQYLESSWTSNNLKRTIDQPHISFCNYCDTFWQLDSKIDENVDLCEKWWVCSEDQWQCRSGQCIENSWILDGEWDCSDASDEEGLFHTSMSQKRTILLEIPQFKNKFEMHYQSQAFHKICNLTNEFPCLPIHISNPLTNLTSNRPCINLDQIGDETIDCHGGIDERNRIQLVDRSEMLGYNYWCPSSNSYIPYWLVCAMSCPNTSDDKFECTKRQNVSTCGNIDSFACFNGTCLLHGRCDRIRDCIYGEDEYMCDHVGTEKTMSFIYRKQKEIQWANKKKVNRLFHSLNHSYINQSIDSSDSKTDSLSNITSKIFSCNRGISVYTLNQSIVCFCPMQYYGDRCQFHADRLSILFHLNVSLSLFVNNNNQTSTMFKLIILFQFKNEILSIEQLYAETTIERIILRKTLIYFLYSRSSKSFNRSNLINNHSYSISIEMYKLIDNQMPLRVAVWQYRISFAYLPVYRLAKVLQLTETTQSNNICSSNPCSQNQECHLIANEISKYICLCKSHFTGENCSIEDRLCAENYCSFPSFCKSRYENLLEEKSFPYCICSLNRFGERRDIEHDQCSPNPCQHGGQCFPRMTPSKFICVCSDQYHGQTCQLSKSIIQLYINQSLSSAISIVQYFRIEYILFNLILVHQVIHENFIGVLEYTVGEDIVPDIVIMRLYYSYLDRSPQIYLLSLHINQTFVNQTSEISENNQCIHVETIMSNLSPIEYHYLCQINKSLICFYDSSYLCLCSIDHSRVECFNYNHNLDHCSYCLADGLCLKGDPLKVDDFICLCPQCHSGLQCQFNSNSFVFTLDQLFYIDLISSKQTIVMSLLIFVSLLMFIIALPSNLFSLITFRCRKCSITNVGHYLYYLCIINQINIGFLAIRLIHLSVIITGSQSRLNFNDIICKMLSYSLSCSIRLSHWLASLVTLERVYSTIFLKQGWLQKPHIIRRFLILTCLIILLSSVYELIFVRSFTESNNGSNAVCVIDFAGSHRSTWMIIHQTVSIIHSVLPIFINICCTITIICVIINNKMKINRFSQRSDISDTSHIHLNSTETIQEEHQMHDVISEGSDSQRQSPSRFDRLRIVLRDNKDVLTRPTIMLVPSFFSLFSLPLFIVSFTFACRNIEQNPLRYLLITFYFISFIPQMITFFLYVYPSSIYSNEWRSTKIGKYIQTFYNSLFIH